MTINERITKIIESKYQGNKRAFSTAIGVSAAVIENIVGKRQSSPSFEVTNKIVTSIDNINAEWLITGAGAMFNTSLLTGHSKSNSSVIDDTNISIYKLRTDYFNEKQLIPLYEVDAAAGLTNLFDAQVHQVPLDHISVPNAPKCDGAMYVRGDSMYPILKSGDIACYKVIYELENIFYGDIHILDIDIEGDRHLTVKYIQKSELGDEYVTLVSHNQHYAPREIHKSQIKSLALMKLSIRYNSIS